MGTVLFTNVRIFDGTGEPSYLGEVLVQGNRIKHVGRGSRTVPNGHMVIDGAGATLMPGMTEAHTHFSWNNAATLEAIFRMPPEEHTLLAAQSARTYLDMGWTSCVGAAAAKPRLDVVIRNAIDSGQIPGPRYLAASQEIATLGGLGDTTPAVVADLRENVHDFWDRGLLGFALHPDFPSTPYIYALYTYDFDPLEPSVPGTGRIASSSPHSSARDSAASSSTRPQVSHTISPRPWSVVTTSDVRFAYSGSVCTSTDQICPGSRRRRDRRTSRPSPARASFRSSSGRRSSVPRRP